MFEYELELDREFESEFESEYESEQFLGNILSKITPRAVNAVTSLLSEGEPEFEYEDEFEYEYENPSLEAIAHSIGSLMNEGEPEWESDYDALMEHIAYVASQSESETEAEAFLPFLIPLAAKALPMIAKAAATKVIPKVAPKLIQGLSRVGRTLYHHPKARPLMSTLPKIAKDTVYDLTRRAAKGQPITNKTAVRSLAHQTAKVLGKPQEAAKTMRRSRIVHSKRCPVRAAARRQHRSARLAN
jgi:hypothetical protein